ncbi:helix-turn-helix transcriptional regulator [Curtobacterium sp. NPDC089689]|uniref:helix-turn-helix transcriptional regulator n=1 Tax=Curtobacterium sp. NPDC089689 TaxID=3363968 RepID=UPI00382FC177
MSRRAAVTPEQAGLPNVHSDRRVPGLRREEVATLAGVSAEYYTRLEKGNIGGVSESVLNAVATALRLSDVEREYLFDLARAATASPTTRSAKRPAPTVRASVQRMLDSMIVPAIVQTPDQTIVASNLLARTLYAPMFAVDPQPNFARFNYLDPRSQQFFVDWEWSRRTTAAILRFELGRHPQDRDLAALIEELHANESFRRDWALSNVHEHRTGVKSFRHPDIGVLEVTFDVFETPGEPGLKMVTYSAPAGTETAEKLAILSSWAAAQAQQPEPSEPTA